MIEVRYAGVVVGRSAIIRELDTKGLFLGITEPMPVGTSVTLGFGDRPGGEEVRGKVEVVSESQELAHAGMRVRFADPRAAALFGTPSEAPPEPEPVVVADVPVASPSPVAKGPVEETAAGALEQAVAAAAAAAGTSAATGGHRRIVVDASADKAREAAAPEAPAKSHSPSQGESPVEGHTDDGGDLSAAVAGDTGRIAAPDPSAFGSGGGGKKGRRNRRR